MPTERKLSTQQEQQELLKNVVKNHPVLETGVRVHILSQRGDIQTIKPAFFTVLPPYVLFSIEPNNRPKKIMPSIRESFELFYEAVDQVPLEISILTVHNQKGKYYEKHQ